MNNFAFRRQEPLAPFDTERADFLQRIGIEALPAKNFIAIKRGELDRYLTCPW